MEMHSSGESDTITASYAFGYRRTITGSRFSSNSHVASGTYSTALGRAWKLNLSDSFQMTSDLTTFSATRGDIGPIGGSSFLFSPVSTGLLTVQHRRHRRRVPVERGLNIVDRRVR